MARRPEISVIFLSTRGAIRADFGKNFEAPLFKIEEPIDAESTLFDSVQQVVDDQPPLGQRTIVISPDVWSQIVALPHLSVADMADDELKVALKFETETLSGIEIDEIALAYSSLGRQDDLERYWVSAINRSDLDNINQYLSSAGCREIAITHPAGLAGDSTQAAAHRRIEVWDDLSYFLTHHSTRLERIKQASTTRFEECSSVLFGVGVRSGEDSFANIDTSLEILDLEQDQIFDQWAGRVASNYLKQQDSLLSPLILRIRRSRGTPVRHLAAFVIGMVVIGLCSWHWQSLNSHNTRLRKEIVEIQIPEREKNDYDSQLLGILEKRASFESEAAALADDLKRIRFFLDHQNNRISKLLNLLIDLRTPDFFIVEIQGTEDGMSISGISLKAESAQVLANRLRDHATSLGWMVNPARQEGQEKLTTGGPWDYEILLTDTGPFEFAIQPRKKTAPVLTPNP